MTKENCSGIWVFAEQQNGEINSVVFELLAKAQQLKAHNGEEITAVLPGMNIKELAQKLIAGGADRVIVCENEALEQYSARPYSKAISQLAQKYKPSIILFGATALGRDMAPRAMVRLGTGLTADAIDIGFDEDGDFYQTTPGYGGKILAHIIIQRLRPQLVTVREQIFAPLEPDENRKGEIIFADVSVEKDEAYEVLGSEEMSLESTPIDKATVLVSGGRGLKTQAEVELIEKLAGLLGAEVAGSRPLIDSGLLPHDKQIGQSAKTVKPELIINVAISGSIQYRVGMQGSKKIISINNNKNAPIFDISQFGAVADFKTLIPAIIEEIEKRKAKIQAN